MKTLRCFGCAHLVTEHPSTKDGTACSRCPCKQCQILVHELKRILVIAKLRELRCAICKRAPKEDDVAGMYQSFGAEVDPDERLVWQCQLCMNKGGNA